MVFSRYWVEILLWTLVIVCCLTVFPGCANKASFTPSNVQSITCPGGENEWYPGTCNPWAKGSYCDKVRSSEECAILAMVNPVAPRAALVAGSSASCSAIGFSEAAGEETVTFDSAGTTLYAVAMYRQTDGSFTAQDYSSAVGSSSPAGTNAGTATQVQTAFAGCFGVGSWTPVAHPTLLAVQPGTMSQQGVVAGLGGAKPYATIGVAGNNQISVSLDTQTTMGSSTTNYNVGTSPVSLLVADFNNDGKPDVAVLNQGSSGTAGSVSILIGNGDGTLKAATSANVGVGPVSMTSRDFNGEGRADLAVVNATDNTVTILLANADGSMRAGNTYTLPGGTNQGATTIVSADFDGDGKPDLMVRSLQGFILLKGKGDGTFLTAQTVASNPNYMTEYLAAGDFNKDGKMDLVSLNEDATVTVLLNGGGGTFTSQQRYVAGTDLSSGVFVPGIFVMDFNDDGNPDLVLASGHPDALGPNPMFITVLYGNGDGTFKAAPAFDAGYGSVAMAAADFNGDGLRDVVVAVPGTDPLATGSANLRVLLGKAGGGFQPATELSPGHMRWVTTADVNRDGHADIIAVDTSHVYVWLGNGDGTFQTASSYAVGSNPTFVTTGDLNGDGLPDLVIAYGDLSLTSGVPGTVLVLTGKSGGGFNAGVSVPTGVNTIQVALADVNGDGKLDLIADNGGYVGGTAGSLTVSLGKGDGTFQAASSITTLQNPTAITVADVNGDGKPDLVVGSATSTGSVVGALLGNGAGAFTAAATQSTYTQVSRLAVADFDGDGKLDVAVVHIAGDSPVTTMHGNGDGTFQAETHLPAGDQPVAAIAADFNGDGRPDLAVLDQVQSGLGWGYAAVFRNSSTTTACAYSFGSGSQAVAAGGGTGSFQVTAATGCEWISSASASWITLAYPQWGGNGGTVNFTVAGNSGAARSGTITAGGQTFAINQAGTSVGGTPLAVSVSPASGNSASSSYTFTFSDSAGWQSINVADILINSNFIDGRHACYVAVVPAQSAVYLVDDAGDAGGPFQGFTLPGAGTAQNSQCIVSGTGSSISGSGNTLTVTLAIRFQSAFAGNRVFYLAAVEAAGANSGWQALGTWAVPGGPAITGPAVSGVNPARSSGTGGGSFVFTFTDTNGWQDLGVTNVLINNALDGRQACYLAYSRPYNVLYLMNDAGNGLLPGLTLSGSGTLGNSQCTVTGAGSSASGSGNTLTLTLNMTFPSSFAGNRIVYAAARSNGDVLNSGWQAVGSRTVQ